MRLTVRPLTPSRWKDFESLFGPRGACDGCWCQWARRPAKEYREGRGEGNRRAMRRLVASGEAPGLLAYAGREAVAWCALGPRASFRRLERSRVLKPVDGKVAWCAPCFFVAKPWRGRGATVTLLKAAAAHARRRGATLLEGYPVDARGRRSADAFLWWGEASAFRKAGFREAARRSPSRPIMRKGL